MTTALAVPPRLHQTTKRFIDEGVSLLQELVSAFGSPLNVVFPDRAVENVQTFHRTLATLPLQSRIFFAQKVNKSVAITRALATTGIHIDVASSGELLHAFKSGFTADRIEASGPKSESFLVQALQHGITINCDSIEELHSVINNTTTSAARAPVPLFLRLASITKTQNALVHESRFGITSLDEITAALLLLKEHRHHINFLGFSYHLNAASEEEKSTMLEETIQKTLYAKSLALAPRYINIGGGFSIRRSADRDSWLTYVSAIKQSVLGTTPPLTWNNNGYGFRAEQGVLRGAPSFAEEPSRDPSDTLLSLLQKPLPSFGNLPAATVIGEQLLTFVIEPGQALLDQAGITLAKVVGTKTSAHGETVVILDMNRSNINVTDIDTLIDPILIPQKTTSAEDTVGVYFSGNLCLHGDMLTKHRVFLSQKPERGDLVLFANTAPYAMDFAESETLRQRIAPKIAVACRNGRWRWWTDEQYEHPL
jgi:diaminopimelate decarboxylase